MTTNVLSDIDRSTLDELRRRMPNLSDINLSDIEFNPPRMEHVGRRADEAVDRLLGRSRTPTWPWMVAAVGVVAVVGAIAAWWTWGRRPAMTAPMPSATGPGVSPVGGDGPAGGDPFAGTTDSATPWGATDAGSGLTAAEASLTTDQESREGA